MSIRRLHVGIDYGTSTSKLIFRDYGAPGGEKAYFVTSEGQFRIPSTVCCSATELFFGLTTKDDCDIYESIKMRVADEVLGKRTYYAGPEIDLPTGFKAADLAALTIWYLLSKAEDDIRAYLHGNREGISISTTVGVPMSFFTTRSIRNTFVSVVRTAWNLFRKKGAIPSSSLTQEKALELLAAARVKPEDFLPEFDVRNWIRSEAEAAMLWPFRSPSVASGPYAKLDVGAGTSHASFYRIVSTYMGGRFVNSKLAFFGAISEPCGMDNLDRAIAEALGYTGDYLNLRGLEEEILRKEAKARGGILDVEEGIYEAYRRAWIQTHRKINQTPAELRAWESHKLFFIGGGSLVSKLLSDLSKHPANGQITPLMPLEPPDDLFNKDGSHPLPDQMRFSAVAYGLSHLGIAIPEAITPDDIPEMNDPREVRQRVERDDIYGK